jgi:hypothetical protein
MVEKTETLVGSLKALKQKGNDCFKQRHFKNAITLYEEALARLKFKRQDVSDHNEANPDSQLDPKALGELQI